MPTDLAWTTHDELNFINHLGQWTKGVFLGRRLQLLRGYRQGLEYRVAWDGLDRMRVISEAERAIGREVMRQLRLGLGMLS